MQNGQLNLSCSLRSHHSPQRNSRYEMLRLVAMIATSTKTTRELSTFSKRKIVLIILSVWLILVSIQPSETIPQKTDRLRLRLLAPEKSSKARMRAHVSSFSYCGQKNTVRVRSICWSTSNILFPVLASGKSRELIISLSLSFSFSRRKSRASYKKSFGNEFDYESSALTKNKRGF